MKRFISIVLVVALILGFAIIGYGANSIKQQQAKQQVVTITFASMKTYGINTMPDLIKKFEATHPNIKVKYIELPSPNNSTEIHQYLVTNLGAKSQNLDVFTADCIWFAEFAQAGWLLQLDKYFTKKELSQYFSGAVKTVTYKNHLVGVPWYLDGGLLYYRKDLLEKYNMKPPRTWDELIYEAKTILSKEKNPKLQGFVWQGKQAEVLTCDLVEFLGSDGAVLDKDMKPVINNKEGLRAAQLMYDLIYKDKISPQSVTTYDEEPSRTVFTDGNAIFLRNWTYVWGISQDPKVSKIVGKVGVVPVPAFKGSKSASCLGGYQFAINNATKHQKEAVEFAKFLSSPESQKYFALKINFAPTRPAVYDDPEVKKKAPFLSELKNVFIYATPRPITPFYPQISLKIQAEFSKLLTNLQTPKETVDNLANEIKQIQQ